MRILQFEQGLGQELEMQLEIVTGNRTGQRLTPQFLPARGIVREREIMVFAVLFHGHRGLVIRHSPLITITLPERIQPGIAECCKIPLDNELLPIILKNQ